MDVAASEFFSDKDKTYDLNFKEDVRTATYYAFIYSELVFMLLYRPMIINDYLYQRILTLWPEQRRFKQNFR